MAQVTICSKLPSGIYLSLPDKTILIYGSQVSSIDGTTRLPGETIIRSEDWEAIKKLHGSQDYFKNGYLWEKVDSKQGNEDKAKRATSKETDGLNPKEIKSSKENKTKIE